VLVRCYRSVVCLSVCLSIWLSRSCIVLVLKWQKIPTRWQIAAEWLETAQYQWKACRKLPSLFRRVQFADPLRFPLPKIGGPKCTRQDKLHDACCHLALMIEERCRLSTIRRPLLFFFVYRSFENRNLFTSSLLRITERPAYLTVTNVAVWLMSGYALQNSVFCGNTVTEQRGIQTNTSKN